MIEKINGEILEVLKGKGEQMKYQEVFFFLNDQFFILF